MSSRIGNFEKEAHNKKVKCFGWPDPVSLVGTSNVNPYCIGLSS